MPDLAVVIAGIMLAALIFYAVLGGADFGGGVWDLLAWGPRAREQRQAIADAIGPIWEANHVWLILVITIMFTGFSKAFAVIMTALHVPLTLMLIGIVLRGTAFTFRTYDVQTDDVQRRWSRVFAVSSLVTPFLLGVSIGTISSGNITVEDGVYSGGWFAIWLQPFPLAVGGFTVSLFAYLAAVYLVVELRQTPDVREEFRKRALGAAVAVGGFALLTFLLAGEGAPHLAEELLGEWWSWPLQVMTGLCAAGAIVALVRRYDILARTLAVAQVALILLGWGLALYPYLVVDDVTISEAAAPERTLWLLFVALSVGSLILFPALFYLYRVFKGPRALAVVDPGLQPETGDAGSAERG